LYAPFHLIADIHQFSLSLLTKSVSSSFAKINSYVDALSEVVNADGHMDWIVLLISISDVIIAVVIIDT